MRVGLCAAAAGVCALAVGTNANVFLDDRPSLTKAAPAGGLDPREPLPPDSRLVTGTLDNGLSYIVLKHSNPPGRANMFIHVSTGSLNEKDNQRGIAHYLEHMAFNGSEHFPPGSVLDFFQSMGLTFGQHQNAFTSFDQTSYILSFPDTTPGTVERGMRFFSDVASRLTLSQEEIDKERQVIFEEKRTRLGAAQRIQDYVLERLIPGSLIGVRLPIGVEGTLSKVGRADFVDYYSHWYVPSNMTVIVVADAEPSEMVGQISRAFSGGEKRPKPIDQDPMVKPYDTTRAIVATDPEQTRGELAIINVSPKEPPVMTVGDLRRDLVRRIGVRAFDRRIGAKLAAGGAPYVGASAQAQNLFNAATVKEITCEGKPEVWREMLTELGTDVQRARLHGFSAREIDDVKSQLIAQAEQFVEQERTLPARAVIGALNQSVASGNVFLGAENELALYRKILPTITPEEIGRAFADDFDTRNVTFVAQLPSTISGGPPTESDLIAAGRKALDVTPPAEKENERPTALMASTPTPGQVLEPSEHAASAVTSAWLANGVRVHYRFMDIVKDEVTVQINLAAGSILETAGDRGVSEVAGLAWERPATGTLSSTNIRDLMTGKKVRVRAGQGGGFGGRGGPQPPTPDTMTLTVTGSPADLETGMQLAHLLLSDPLIEGPAFDQWKTSQLQEIESRKTSPPAAFLEAASDAVYPKGEVRTRPLTADQVSRLSVDAAQRWLKKAVGTAPVEVTVVGDIPKDRAMSLVATYLGSLSKRDRIGATTLDPLRKITRPKGPIAVDRDIETQTPLAVVLAGFYGSDARDVSDTRLLQMASRILSTRILKEVREEKQLAYSPRAQLRAGTTFPGFGVFAMLAPTEPGKVEELVKTTNSIYDTFGEGGPTAEELDTAKKQVANDLDEQMKQPDFWVQRTGTLDYRDVRLDDVTGAGAAYQAMTADQIKAAFNKYHRPEAVIRVVVKPAAKQQGRVDEAPDKKKEVGTTTKPQG